MANTKVKVKAGRSKGAVRRTPVRKWIEEVQQPERNLAQEYFDIAGVMLLVIGADRKVAMVNRKGSEILGFRHDEIIGKDWFDNFLPERVKGEINAIFDRLMAGKIELDEFVEGVVLTRSGEERIIAWHNTVLCDENGAITGTLSSGEDITARKKAEEELYRQEEYFRVLIEKSSDAVAIIDGDGNILYESPSFQQILGYEPEERVGQSGFEDIHPDGGQPLQHGPIGSVVVVEMDQVGEGLEDPGQLGQGEGPGVVG